MSNKNDLKKVNRNKLHVIKRDGSRVPVQYDEITKRLTLLCDNIEPVLDESIDPFAITGDVVKRIKDNTTTTEIDNFTAEFCANNLSHPDFGTLAARIIISSHHKNMMCHHGILFSEIVEALTKNVDERGEQSSIVNEDFYKFVIANKEEIDKIININRDYLIDFFGYKTLLNSYLLKVNKMESGKYTSTIVECPQHMFLRVALYIHKGDFVRVKETYDLLSQKFFTHATPTLFNAGTRYPQLFSCFLLNMEDSIDGIFKCFADTARISKRAGGIGISISDIRGNNSYIRGTAGKSDGIVPMLKVLNDTARYVNQCFVPETYIYTRSGPKFIKDITSTDYVITHDGSYKKVNEVIASDFSGSIRSIMTEHTFSSIKCTDVHEILVLRNEESKYIPALEVIPGDKLCIPVSGEFYDNPSLTEEICRFYGLMLSCGYIWKTDTHEQCSITVNNKNDLEFVTNFLTKSGISKYLSEQEDPNTFKFRAIDKSYLLSYEDMYKNNEKYINEYIMKLPLKKLFHVIRGFGQARDIMPDPTLKVLLGHTSSVLVHSLKMILLKFGLIPKSEILKTTKGLNYYVLSVPKEEFSEKLKCPVTDTIYSKVVSNTVQEYTGKVYDLNIIDNHNYLTEMGIVHNSGKRNGSFAVYLEPWHVDVLEFLECKLPHGTEERRAKDLFYALWIPDLFMSRVRENKEWSLMCPSKCPGLTEKYGKEFEELYTKYETEGRASKKMKAIELWNAIINSQIETGVPYMCYKDAVNRKSNHKNLGTIKSSNLCVAPETMVLTKLGQVRIKHLEDKHVEVWNGKEWSKTLVKKTGTGQKLIKIKFSNGSMLDCTEYHKFYIKNGYKKIIEIEAKDLYPGVEIEDYVYPADPENDSNGNTRLLTMRDIKVTTIIDEGRIDDTYCFNEPKEHKAIFNGILTGQCTEICEYNDTKKYACCVLASVVLSSFVNPPSVEDSEKLSFSDEYFDYQKLYSVVRVITRNLDTIIDLNYYPTPETEKSNFSERPIGIGVQGLADVFFKLKIPYDSDEAAVINKKIFETIYFAALTESCQLAKEKGTYPSYKGSPTDLGQLQYDLWIAENPNLIEEPKEQLEEESKKKKKSRNHKFALSGMWSFDSLKEEIAKYGLRNSLVTALMPTASTAQIMGSTEAFEPITSNVYTRRVLAGEYIVFNKYLAEDLVKLGLWSEKMKNKLIKYRGSVQKIRSIPQHLKNVYKTCWEIKQSVLVDLSAERGPFIDQSQSLNLFFEKADYNLLSKAHFYGHSKGLKTGSYYIRSKAAGSSEAFTVEDDDDDDEPVKESKEPEIGLEGFEADKKIVTKSEKIEECEMCSA